MADSTHEDVLALAVTRLGALTSITPAHNRVLQRASIEGTWAQNLHVPCIVVSGEGLERSLPMDSCRDAYAYPLVVRIVDCGPVEDTDKVATHQKWRYLIKRAFVHKPLTMTISGAQNFDIVYVDGPTIEPGHLLEYDRIVRPIVFDVHVHEPIR